ncbi:DUF1450 domain-containing protein [Anaerobacillus sp. HL2]|nr:DUF1450 domain-containing protein [Anaerobacillus sp. HL2]
MKVKRKGCIGKCKTCKHSPFSVVNGKVISCDSAKDLFKRDL